MSEALSRLESLGHTTIPFQPPNLEKSVERWLNHILADQGKHALIDWEGEILDQSIEINRLVFKIPVWIRRIVLEYIVGQVSKLTAFCALSACAPRGVSATSDLWDSVHALNQDIALMLEMMNKAHIDVILAPGFAYPGQNHHCEHYNLCRGNSN